MAPPQFSAFNAIKLGIQSHIKLKIVQTWCFLISRLSIPQYISRNKKYPVSSISRNIVSFSKNIGDVRINLFDEEDAIKDRNAQGSLFQEFKFLRRRAAKNGRANERENEGRLGRGANTNSVNNNGMLI